MSCIKIAVRDAAKMPANLFSDDGYVYLDLPIDFDMRLTRRLTEVTAKGELELDYLFSSTISYSPKNKLILETFTNPNLVDNQILPINIIIMVGGEYDSESTLYVKDFTLGGYNCDLDLTQVHWAYKLSNILLKDLSYDDFEHTCANIQAVNSTEYPYDFGGDMSASGLAFPLVDYGAFHRDRDLRTSPRDVLNSINPLEFWRPYFYVAGLLERAFCAINYKFKSPFFETEAGRSWIMYMIRKDYGTTDSGLINQLSAEAVAQSDYFIHLPVLNSGTRGIVKFKDVIVDPLGSFHVDGGYRGVGEVDVKGLVKFKVPVSKEAVRMVLARVDRDKGLDALYIVPGADSTFEFTDLDDEKEFEFEAKGVPVSSLQELAVIAIAGKPVNAQSAPEPVISIEILLSSYIKITGTRLYPSGTYNPADLFDPELTAFQFVKSIAEICQGKFVTSVGERSATMYVPFDVTVFGEDVEGFYIEETIEDISNIVDIDSVKVENTSRDRARYVVKSFKDSTDKYIESQALIEPLWSVKYDLGEKYTDSEPEIISNSLIEPTMNRTQVPGRDVLHIPIMRGEAEHTWDINPRILHFFGNVEQEYAPTIRYCSYENNPSDFIPTASQYCPITLGEHNVLGSPQAIPEANIVFGVADQVYDRKPINNIFRLFHLRELLESTQTMFLEYLAEITSLKYEALSFRNLYRIHHLGEDTSVTLMEVKDFHRCEKIPTPIRLRPTIKVSDKCDIVADNNGDSDHPCQNFPAIEVSESGNCFIFTLGGRNNTPVDTVAFSYRLESSSTWINLANLSNISAQLCDITEPFYVRATVAYDGAFADCVDIELPPMLVSPCPILVPEMTCQNFLIYGSRPGGAGQPALRFTLLLPPPLGADIELLSSRVGETGGNTQIGYAMTSEGTLFLGDTITAPGNWTFEIDLQYKNCPPQTFSIDCVLEEGGGGGGTGESSPCGAFEISLECEQTSEGCFVFNRNGSMPYEIDDHIKYRTSWDDGVTWEDWRVWDNEVPVCAPLVQARWFVQTCDDLCPFRCSPIVTCQETICPNITPLINCIEDDMFGTVDNPTGADLTGITYEWYYSADDTTYTTTGITTMDMLTVTTEGFYKLYISIPNCPVIQSEAFEFTKPSSGTQTGGTTVIQ